MTRGQRLFVGLRWLFFLGSIGFLIRFVEHTLSGQVGLLPKLPPAGIAKVGVSTLVFSATAVFSAMGWRGLLECLGHRRRLRVIGPVFLLTQIAKYLPGNVGHHIGRITLAKRSLGISAAVTSVSILQESALASLAALLMGFACFAFQPPLRIVEGFDLRLFLGVVIVAGLMVLGLANACKRGRSTQHSRAVAWLLATVPTWSSVLRNLPFYVAVTLLNSLAVALVADAIAPISANDVILLSGAFALSWVIGFLLPGAPGGLGVREAAFVALLSHAYASSVLLAVALLCRLASVAADLVIFAGGYALSRLNVVHLKRR